MENFSGSILIIKNGHEIDLELLTLLENKYQVYVIDDASVGLDLIADKYIDIFVIISNDHQETFTQKFLSELKQTRSIGTQIIFISKNPTEALQAKANTSTWYLLDAKSLNHTTFLKIVELAMGVAIQLDDRSFVVEKAGNQYRFRTRDVSLIERSSPRRVEIFYRDQITGEEASQEFYFQFPLARLLDDYGIQNEFEQANQSQIINTSKVKTVIRSKMVIILIDGTVISTTKNFFHRFWYEKNE